MVDNYFSQFGQEEDADLIASDVPAKGPSSYFSSFDSEPDATTIVTKSPPVITPPDQSFDQVPGVSWVDSAYEKLQADTTARKQQEKAARDQKRGDSFLEGLVDPQQYGEFAKGIAPGAVRFGGTVMKGAAGIQQSSSLATQTDLQRQIALFDKIDRGEDVGAEAQGFDFEIAAYGQMTPEQRKAYKQKLAGQAVEPRTPIEDRTLFQAGEATTEFAKELFPAEPGYEQATGRQLGEGIGSLIAGLPASFLGPVPAAVFFGMGGSGEALERAMQFDKAEKKAGRPGLSEEQLTTATLYGIGPGVTDLLPVELLLGRLKVPRPFRKIFANAIGRIGGQAFVEGVQEGGQEFLQNLIAQEVYNPKQELTQGIVPSAGIGAGVGGIAGVAKELVGSFAGRRSRGGTSQETELTENAPLEEIAKAIDQGQQVNREGKGDQLDVAVQEGQQPVATPQEPQIAPETGVVEPGAVMEPEAALPVAEQPEGIQTEPVQPSFAPEELQAAEETFILPEVSAMDEEIGSPVFTDAYAKLTNEEKAELIERSAQQGEDIADLLEELAIRRADVSTVAAMAVQRGLTEDQIAQVRQIVAEQAPDLATGFDELISLLPRRARAGQAGGQGRAAPQFSPEQAARISEIESSLTSIASQVDLGKTIDQLSKSVSASDWKAAGQQMTGQSYKSGKAARDAIFQRVSDRILLDERVDQVRQMFDRPAEQAETARRKEVGSTLADFARSSAGTEIAERFNILQEDAASLLKRNAFTGEAKTIVDRLAGKAAKGNEHALNNDWEALGQVVSDMTGDAAALTELDARPEARLITQWVNTAGRLAREGNIPLPERAEPSVTPEKRTAFADVLNSRVPRSKWADSLGITDEELQPLIEEAIEKKFLRRDKNGVIRRVPKSQRTGSFAAMALPEDLPDTLPGDGNVTLTPEAADQKQEMNRAVQRAAMRILPDAVKVDVVDNIAIATLKKEDQMLALREDAAFQRWFGDSKVVDENGEPLVVYHGTRADFDKFSLDPVRKIGEPDEALFFSVDPKVASDYAASVFGSEGANVLPVFLRMENPLNLRREAPGFRTDVAEDIAAAKAGGHDGIVYAYKGGEPNELVVFEPTQIKSAIGNRGTFDPTDPRISYALRKTPSDPSTIVGEEDGSAGEQMQFVSSVDQLAIQDELAASIAEEILSNGAQITTDGRVRLYHRTTREQAAEILQSGQMTAEEDGIFFSTARDGQAEGYGDTVVEFLIPLDAVQLDDAFGNEAHVRIPLERAGAIIDVSSFIVAEPSSPSKPSEGSLSLEGRTSDAIQIETRLQEIGSEILRLQNFAVLKPKDKQALEDLRQERQRLIRSWEELPLDVRAAKDQLLAIRAYHGSPHDFDRFDLSRIGTGEGAQAFGHGLYFAENPATAQSYRDVLSEDVFLLNGEPLETGLINLASAKLDGSLGELKAEIEGKIADVKAINVTDEYAASLRETKEGVIRANQNALDKWENTLKDIARVEEGDVRRSGALYEVEIDVEPEQLLDYDIDLNDQPSMLDVLKPLAQRIWPDLRGFQLNNRLRARDGRSFYDDLIGFTGTPQRASDLLREAGIPGIRYLDQGSRDTGEGTRNIVIFDDSLVKITKKNGKPVTAEERQGVIDEMLARRRGRPEALGKTDPYNMVISISMKAVEAEAAMKGVSPETEAVRVLRHEAIEFFNSTGMFTAKEWKLLQETARKQGWVESTGIRAAYEQAYQGMPEAELSDLLVKEAIAEQYSEFHHGRKQFKGKIAEVFQRIKDFISRVSNFMRGEGFQTWDDVFTRIDEGEFKARFEKAFPDLAPQPETGTRAIQATAGRLADSPARRASAGTEQPAQSLADLVNSFNKALGLTVRQGRLDPGLKRAASMAGNQVRGQTSMASGVVRLRVPNEIDTLAHEGGHALENRFQGALEAVKRQHGAELTPLASPGPDALSEGFAEWFRRYVTNPAAAQRVAPGFTAAFEQFLGANDPAMQESLKGIQTGYQEWINAPSGGAVASSIATTVAPGSTQEFVREFKEEGLKNTFQNWTDRIYTAAFDDLHPIRMAVDGLLEIAKKNVRPSLRDRLDVKATDNAYKLLRLARDGYAAGHMDLLHGVHDYQSTAPSGPSLQQAIATAFGGYYKSQWNEAVSIDFGAYLTSRRMVQEWGRFQNGEISAPPDKFSLADHRQAIKDFEAKYPGFAQGAQQVYAYLDNMLRKKRDAGLITTELYDDLIGRQDYVPVMRDMSDRGGVEGASAARKDKYSVISKFRGSQRDVINPLESIAKDSYETAMIIARNDALKALDALARAAGPDGGRFAERIPAHEMQATQVDITEAIKAASKSAGIDPADMQIMLQSVDDQLGDNTVAQIWRAGEISEKGEAIVYLWENGKRIPIRLADGKFGHDMLHAITGLNREAEGWWVSLLSLPSTVLRTGVTASLDFIGANFIRDQVSAWVLTRNFVPFYDGARGIYNDLTMQDVSRIYSRVGGIMGGANVAAQHESRIKREVLQLRRKGIRFTLNPFTRDFWRMTEFSETGTRLAVFEKAFERAKTDGLTDWESSVEAAFIARDYIDFGRRGSRMLAARRLIPFFNAALQGLDRGIRGMRGRVDADKVLRTVISPYIKSRTGQPLSEVEQGNKKQAAQAWGYMVALGMVGLGLSLLYKDDEEYEEISDYIKATHWLIRIDGEWVRIPKPFELAFFSNLVERTFDYVHKDDPTAVKRFIDGLYEITVPPHSIPGVAVTTELITDYSFFSGRAIVGPFLKSLPPELQFNAYASEFGKYVGKQVGVSPAYVDHFITGFGASYGREFVNASDRFMPALGKLTDGALGLPTAPVADPALQDEFFIRRFTTDPKRGSSSIRKFWDMMSMENGKFVQAANGYKHLVDKVRDAMGAQEYLDRLPKEQKAYALLMTENSGSRSKYRRLHPLNRAKEIVSIAGGMKKEINLNRLYEGKDGEPIELSPSQMRTVSDLLSDITMREARNALIALKERGWAQKKTMNVDTVYAELKAAAPKVHKEMVDRLKSKKLPSYETVVKSWPVARDRIIEDGQKAIITDLYRRDYSIGQGSGVFAQ